MQKVLFCALLTVAFFFATFLARGQAYYDATKSLPTNHVKDGSVDYTSILQAVINKYEAVIFPNFPVLINHNGLKLRSKSVYKFQPASSLIMKPNDKAGYNMLDCNGKSNIIIYAPVLYGDRYNHIGNNGEWGFGISIRGSRNVKVYNAKVFNAFGDGIYIGRLNKEISKDIIIDGASVYNSRRNGLSITSGINITVVNSVFSNSQGKGPSSGIDIEPNVSDDELQNIILKNIKTSNNENWGLLINLVNLRKDNDVNKRISIRVDKLVDNGSRYGMSFWLNRKNNYRKNIVGRIQLENIQLINSREEPIKFYDTNNNVISLDVRNLYVTPSQIGKLEEVVKLYRKEPRINFRGIRSK